jgi:UrcA family protein
MEIIPCGHSLMISTVINGQRAILHTPGDYLMKNSTSLMPANILRTGLATTLAIGALSLLSVSAQAAEPDEITISAPAIKIVGRDFATNAPIEQSTVTARVFTDPVTLTTNSGVALLKDSVVEAARKACETAAPLDPYDQTCVFEAVKSAQPQVDAAIARARSNAMNG